MIYKKFKIKDIFSVKRGNAIDIKSREFDNKGVNCISAKDSDNGFYMKTIPAPKETVFEKSITINNNGSVGFTYWQEKPFIASSDVSVLVPHLEYVDKIDKYVALFFCTILSFGTSLYGYGLKLNNSRLLNLEISLPVDGNEQIDFKYMGSFMKELYYKKTINTKNKSIVLSKAPYDIKSFLIGDLFEVVRGKRIVKGRDYIEDRTATYCYPVITARTSNNSVDGYYTDFNCKGNSIVCGGEASGMFATYQEVDCWVMDRSRIFIPKPEMKINKLTAMYIVTLMRANSFKFSYNRSANPDGIKALCIDLPVDSDGCIDFEYMEYFIKSIPYGDCL